MVSAPEVTVFKGEYTPGAKDFKVSTGDSPREAPKADSSHVLIIGGGVSGLLVAWMLLDQGTRVTILAKEWARTWDFSESRITSQIAGALWEMPPGGCGLTEIESPGAGWATVQHYRDWAMQSYAFYTAYADISDEHEKGGHSLGLSVAKLHQFFYEDVISSCTDRSLPQYEHNDKYKAIKTYVISGDASRNYAAKRMIRNHAVYHNKEEITNAFKQPSINLSYGGKEFKSGYTHDAPIINTDKALGYLMALVQRKGATLETRVVKDLKETGRQLLADYKADVIVNATGLGAKELVNDQDVYPVRGAIRRVENTRYSKFRHLNDAYLVPAQMGPGNVPTKTVFIVPRNDDILYVGSIIQPHSDTMNLTAESPEVRQMWDRAGEFMPSLSHAGFVNHFPFAQGLRPFTKKNVKVRADEDCGFPLVHNYGHGGSGWTLGVGTAQCAVYIIQKLISDKRDLLKVVKSADTWADPTRQNRIVNAIEGTLGETEKQELLTAIQGSPSAKSYLANRLINDKTVFVQLVESSCEQPEKDDFLDDIKGSLDENAKQALSGKIQTSPLLTLYLKDKLFADKPGLLEVVMRSNLDPTVQQKFRNAIKGTPEQADKDELLVKIDASTEENIDKDRLKMVVNKWYAELNKASAKVVNDAIYLRT
ncbi:FAD dependent oxidoreductase-domain-containing protein [Aspergillus pseudonomiae]|uniref:FAD dependent oxidoreductase-domain-containing protein n=1 Tax=Aspergillus pseudonomiae TaxID=1506151 RepID=A0A5N7DM66_9EURO|nr:FAD dependent oxidoreductase-domain-containing protein [Aspergillus pseudonomiae]KAB8259867.1 FAD dependent oxidoreductase-domain-containing protein [Aspergillus pseudonomiae]KAE8407542.1 FAD dependent oxidoreductase-domain-containing protein [Aspergillus pseudonomiae]